MTGCNEIIKEKARRVSSFFHKQLQFNVQSDYCPKSKSNIQTPLKSRIFRVYLEIHLPECSVGHEKTKKQVEVKKIMNALVYKHKALTFMFSKAGFLWSELLLLV